MEMFSNDSVDSEDEFNRINSQLTLEDRLVMYIIAVAHYQGAPLNNANILRASGLSRAEVDKATAHLVELGLIGQADGN